MNFQEYILHHSARSVLGKGKDPQEIKENSFRFVNTVAYDLRTLGHNEVFIYEKKSGSNSFGYSSDILVIDNELYDCVVDSDGPNASPAFNDAGLGDDTRFRNPDPNYLVNPTPNPNPVPPVDPPVDPPSNNYPPLPETYEQCLGEFNELSNAYLSKHGHQAGGRDYGHYAWRRFIEHWKFEDMLRDV